MTFAHRTIRMKARQNSTGFLAKSLGILVAALSLTAAGGLRAQTSPGKIGDITGNYSFVGPNDNLALLQEEGMIKGYIDVLQGPSESDAVLSYPIIIGSRKGNQVEFRTRRIHEKYYRFSGTVERGKGRKPNGPDYLQLVGELQTITHADEPGKEVVERQQVVFKFKGESQ